MFANQIAHNIKFLHFILESHGSHSDVQQISRSFRKIKRTTVSSRWIATPQIGRTLQHWSRRWRFFLTGVPAWVANFRSHFWVFFGDGVIRFVLRCHENLEWHSVTWIFSSRRTFHFGSWIATERKIFTKLHLMERVSDTLCQCYKATTPRSLHLQIIQREPLRERVRQYVSRIRSNINDLT